MTSHTGPVTPGGLPSPDGVPTSGGIPTPDGHPSRHGLPARRLVLLILACGTIALGLGVHWALPGSAGDFAADALYAVLIYFLVGVIAPRAPALLLGAVSFGFCLGLELFQLTGIPLIWADAFTPASLVLGTTFVTRDIVAYAIGVALIACLDTAARHLGRTAHP
ncbi:uncharacterized protein DUF2809 [Glaciihabitans tibetensis]|uniref:Uncharacterized protein DUF2809 n=1 Tax=Glaciihabitans tibetensis TaxID=1266600 RepID=A0A2T0V5A9_9MICO|nr:DUF2809 domain-containing protein [Glaciihabitans tibetensis]PRY65379.1 uncharacterized protein DUF2809 [Glaciihabitans tibetensis]